MLIKKSLSVWASYQEYRSYVWHISASLIIKEDARIKLVVDRTLKVELQVKKAFVAHFDHFFFSNGSEYFQNLISNPTVANLKSLKFLQIR